MMNKKVLLVIPIRLHEHIRRAAKAEDRAVNNYIKRILVEHTKYKDPIVSPVNGLDALDFDPDQQYKE